MDRGKRILKRIRLISALEVFDRNTGERLGFLEDITEEGMRVKGPTFLKTGRKIRVRLNLPWEMDGRADVELLAQCVWVESLDTPGLYEFGFRFIEAPPEAIEIVDMLIRRFQR